MESEASVFLQAFFAAQRREKVSLTDEEIKKVERIAIDNSVIPITYSGVRKPDGISQPYESLRRKALSECSRQAIMNNMFLNVLKRIMDANLRFCVVKGPAVARYYPAADMRTSTDVDLLVSSEDVGEVTDLIVEAGGRINEKLTDDICVHVFVGDFLHIEIHTELFDDRQKYAPLFKTEELLKEENIEYIEYDGVRFPTLKPQLHLSYLICHSAVHFTNAGCGIRQLADCWIFADNNVENVVFPELKELLEKYSVLRFAQTVFTIGVKYAGADERILMNNVAISDDLANAVLFDSVIGGTFGRSSDERAATTTITRKKKMSVFNALFPPSQYLKKRYPNRSLFGAWLKRIVDYLKRGGNPAEKINTTLQIAQERKRLISDLGIYAVANRTKNTSADSFVNDVMEQFEMGNTVKLRISGNSMAPFLKNGRDFVTLKEFDGKPKTGDIYFFTRANGAPVMHRIVKMNGENLYMCGDSQLVCELISRERIFACADSFVIKGKKVGKKSLKCLFYSIIWRNLDFRRIAFKVLIKWKKTRRKNTTS